MMRSLILALTGSLLLAGHASADELSDLLDRYRAWRGGAAFEGMHALEQESAVSTVGLTGTSRLLATDAPTVRVDTDLKTFRNAMAWREGQGWTLTTGGQIEDLSDSAARDLTSETLMQFERVLDDRARLSLAEPVTIDGERLAVIRVRFDSDLYELRLVPATGELRGMRSVRDRRESLTRYGDWRVVEGVRLPFRIEMREDNGRETVMQVTRADVNPIIPADAFTRPTVAAKHAIAGGARSTRPIPIDLYAGARIFLPGLVQGREVPVLLDSGAEMTVIDRAYAQQLGLKLEGDLPAVGTGGVSSAQLARGVTIQVGDLTLTDQTVAVIDMSAIEKQLGRGLPVVLGKDAFNALAIDIDVQGRQLIFHEADGFRPPAGAVEVPLVLTPSGRAVEVQIEGGEPVLFDFDTGNGGNLLVFPAYWQSHGLDKGRPATTTLSGAVGGLKEASLVSVRKLRFAGVELDNVPAVLTPPGPSAVDGERVKGNIGMGVLGRFRMITNFADGKLYVIPEADRIRAPFPRDRLGLSLGKVEGAIEVRRVSPNSPAAMAGWKAGDRIAEIDGVVAGALDADALRTIVTGAAGRTVRFKLASGEERTLKAADFY